MEKQLIGFLERCGRPRIYEPGEMIFRQGEDEDFLYFVEEGIALVYTVTEEGKERNVLISWPQHFSGLATFFEGGPHRSSAVAMETCKVSVISRRDFTRCCAEFPEIWGLIAGSCPGRSDCCSSRQWTVRCGRRRSGWPASLCGGTRRGGTKKPSGGSRCTLPRSSSPGCWACPAGR